MFLDENEHFIDSRIYTCCQPFLYAKHNIDETREYHKYSCNSIVQLLYSHHKVRNSFMHICVCGGK